MCNGSRPEGPVPGDPVSHGTYFTLKLPHCNHAHRCEDGGHLLLPSRTSLFQKLFLRLQDWWQNLGAPLQSPVATLDNSAKSDVQGNPKSKPNKRAQWDKFHVWRVRLSRRPPSTGAELSPSKISLDLLWFYCFPM